MVVEKRMRSQKVEHSSEGGALTGLPDQSLRCQSGGAELASVIGLGDRL